MGQRLAQAINRLEDHRTKATAEARSMKPSTWRRKLAKLEAEVKLLKSIETN